MFVVESLSLLNLDPATGTRIEIPSVIRSAMKNVTRTDGILCDAILGQGDALDDYSRGSQTAAVEAHRSENANQRALVKKQELAMRLVEKKNSDRARIFKDLSPAPQQNAVALFAPAGLAYGDEPAGSQTT